MESAGNANFCCQRCWAPIQLDSAFSGSMDEHTLAELNLPAIRTPELDFTSQASSLDNYTPSRQEQTLTQASTHQGFTLLGHTAAYPTSNNIGHLSHYVLKSAQLFDLVSSTSDIGKTYISPVTCRCI